MTLRTYDAVSTFRELVCNELIEPSQFLEWKEFLEFENEGEELTHDEKVKIILQLEKKKLFDVLKKKNPKMISKLTKEYLSFSSSSFVSKVWSLCALFRKNIDPKILDRRKEHENMKMMEFTQSELLISLCGVSLPKEMIFHILSFIDLKPHVKSKIGSLSKIFFIIMLMSIKKIVIRPRNLYSTSLLILQNVPEVTIDFNLGQSSSIRMFQIPYLLSNLRNVKHLHLKLHTVQYAKKFFKILFQRKSSEEYYPFDYVQSLEFAECYQKGTPQKPRAYRNRRLDQKYDKFPKKTKISPRIFSGYDLNECFGIIRILKNPPKGLFYIKQCWQLRNLYFTTDIFPIEGEDSDYSFLPENLRSVMITCNYIRTKKDRIFYDITDSIQKIQNRCKFVTVIILKNLRSERLTDKNWDDFKLELVKFIHDPEVPRELNGTIDHKGKISRSGYYGRNKRIDNARLIWKGSVL